MGIAALNPTDPGCHSCGSTGVLTCTSAFWPRWRSRWSGEDNGQHRLGDRRGANADAGVVAAGGDDVERVAVEVDRSAPGWRRLDVGLSARLGDGSAGRWKGRRGRRRTWLREETLRGQLVAVLGAAAELDSGETGADFDALDRVDAHQRMGEVGVEAVEDRLAEARQARRSATRR